MEDLEDVWTESFNCRLKERLHSLCLQLVEVMCVWDCCGCYIKLAEFLSFIVFDPFVDLFITLCIVINTAFMALDHHDMDPTMTNTLKNGNYVRKTSQSDWSWPLSNNQFGAFPIFTPLLSLKVIWTGLG